MAFTVPGWSAIPDQYKKRLPGVGIEFASLEGPLYVVKFPNTQFGGATQEHPLLMARSYAVVKAAVEAFIRETFCGDLY